MIAGSHSVGMYVLVAKGAQGSGRPKWLPLTRKAPTFRCNQGLGSLTGRTPRMTLMETTMIARVVASPGQTPGALAAFGVVPVGAAGVDGSRLTSAGIVPVWRDKTFLARNKASTKRVMRH